MLALVNAMQSKGYAEPALVISNQVQAAGLQKADSLGVTTACVPHKARSKEDFEAELLEALQSAQIDLLCLAGFMRVLSAEFVASWAGRMLNIHPSLLPKYPGLNTHARALEAGDVLHGCTVHEVIPELDAGPILGQAQVKIEPSDTPNTLAQKVLVWEHKLYPVVLERHINGHKEPFFMNSAAQ